MIARMCIRVQCFSFFNFEKLFQRSHSVILLKIFTNRKTRRTSACYERLFINKIRLLFFNRKPYTKCETKHRNDTLTP